MELQIGTNQKFDVKEGEKIYDVLKRNGIYLSSSCGGNGVCGKCKVRIIEGKSRIISYGKLDQKERKKRMTLACLTIPESDLTIEIPKESNLVVGDKIAIGKFKDFTEHLKPYGVSINPSIKRMYIEVPPPTLSDNISDLERLKRVLAEHGLKDMRFSYSFTTRMSDTLRNANWKVEITYIENNGERDAVFLTSPEECNRQYGIAVDIGTTTVVVYLIDILSGKIIDVGSTYNSQMRNGDDVITRIIYATESGGLEVLRDAIISDINTIVGFLKELHYIMSCEIVSAVIAGNTTMAHIFWGLNPEYIREEPYIPTFNYFPIWSGETAKLSIDAQSQIYTVPCIGSYVGGDIVAGILASKMYQHEEIALFMDIGTNGEIVVGNKDWLMTAACSAGPCFEGGGIKHGMRATEGAIEDIKINRDTLEPELKVVGNTNPMGICGSGMIDSISEMFLTGIIDQKGKFIEGINSNRVRNGEDGKEYLFYSDKTRDIVLTEVDIENIIRAKAAIYAGISLLIKEVGLDLDAIEKVYIAGGFGNYIDVEKAKILGMLPDMPEEKFVFLGNTSIMGACLCLLSDDLRKVSESIASKMTYLELSVAGNYMDEYMSAMFLPHTDLSQFPTITTMIQSKTKR